MKIMKRLFTSLLAVCCCVVVFGQTLPAIFDSVPTDLLKSKVFVSFPKNTWLENLVLSDKGDLYVTDYPKGLVYKISPEGKKENYSKINGKIAGVAIYHGNQLLVTGWDSTNKPALFIVGADGISKKILNIEGGMFPNGILNLASDKYLIADSFAGCIWLFDAKTNNISTWLKDDLLARTSPKSEYPAANGLKTYKGFLYVSNTEKQTLIKIPVINFKPGTPAEYLNRVNIDDFTFDGTGNIYAATNVYNSIIKIAPDKKMTTIGDYTTGASGSTAVLIAKNKNGEKVLYVSTSGGMAVPPPTGIEEGKIIEVYLNK